MKFINKQIVVIFWLIFSWNYSHGQINLECNGRDMHSIYFISILSPGNIYRIDSVDSNPSNPILVASSPTGTPGGISINTNLDSISGNEAMYFIGSSSPSGPGKPYYYWNGTAWINTNDSSIIGGAINIGGTANYIFNLDGIGNSVYRNSGNGNDSLLLSNLNTNGNAFFDIATDSVGNFYILFASNEIIVMYNSLGTAIDTFNTSGINLSNGGAGFAILGNKLYAISLSDLYEGVISGDTINFNWIKNIGMAAADIAACPNAGKPLTTNNIVSNSNIDASNAIFFPNPFNEKLKIKVSKFEPIEFVLQDLTGRQMIYQTFSNFISINTEHIANGIYLYELRAKNTIFEKGKLIKN